METTDKKPIEETSIEFKIIASDFIMETVQTNEEFEPGAILEFKGFDYNKNKHLVSRLAQVCNLCHVMYVASNCSPFSRNNVA